MDAHYRQVEKVINMRSSEKIRMAPAHGLYLMEVNYPEEAYERTIEEFQRIRRERIRRACGHDVVFEDEEEGEAEAEGHDSSNRHA